MDTPPPATKEPAKPDPVIEAFRTELLSILKEPLSAKNLNAVTQIAGAASQLLAVRNPRNRLRGRGPGNGMNAGGPGWYQGGIGNVNGSYPNYADYDDEPPDVMGGVGDGPGRMNVDRETFAARVLREIVGLIPQVLRASREDPAETVKALAAAKALGMDDLAEELRKRLIPPTTAEASEAVELGAKDLELSVRFPGTHYATKVPGSDEYLAGPGPMSLIHSLKRPEHEIIDTQSGVIVVPADPAPVTGLEKVPVLNSAGGAAAVAQMDEMNQLNPNTDAEEEEAVC